METKNKEVKPGWKTSEFWFTTIATMIGMAYAAGIVPSEGWIPQALGMATVVLSQMGYSVSRGIAKK